MSNHQTSEDQETSESGFLSESFENLFEEQFNTPGSHERDSIVSAGQVGKVTTAQVIDIDNNFVIADAGLKSYAYIQKSECCDDNGNLEVHIGDTILCLIQRQDDGHGNLVVSYSLAKQLSTWMQLEQARASEEPVTVMAKIVGKVKGGLSCTINSLRAFLPGSHIFAPGEQHEDSVDQLIDTIVPVCVLKTDRNRNNIVISRRKVVEEASAGQREADLRALKAEKDAADAKNEPLVAKGKCIRIQHYGCFIKLENGIAGLLHSSHMIHNRKSIPQAEFPVKLDDEITCAVIKVDVEEKRVSLSLTALTEDPVTKIEQRFPVGSIVDGRVTKICDYGVFCCFGESGEYEGLVHKSEISYRSPSHVSVANRFQVNEQIRVKVIDIDKERRRIALSIKQTRGNPWEEFSKKVHIGEIFRTTITSCNDFGIFCRVNQDIDGLVHIAEISHDMPGVEARKKYKKGDEVDVVVLDVDVPKEHIYLSMKRVTSNPVQTFFNINTKNTPIEGRIKSIDEKGIMVSLARNVDGLLLQTEITSDNDYLSSKKIDDKIMVYILGVNENADYIKLGLGTVPVLQKQKLDNSINETPVVSGTTNVGAMLKATLGQN